MTLIERFERFDSNQSLVVVNAISAALLGSNSGISVHIQQQTIDFTLYTLTFRKQLS